MLYRAIGLMSGSSLDGLDIVFVALQSSGSKWEFEIIAADCIPYDTSLAGELAGAVKMNALDYQLLHTRYGHYLGQQVNRFINAHGLDFKVALVASHGHTTFHIPSEKMTAQLGDGAAIAAQTGLPVVSDLRAMDIAFGGQGAPIVPIGEELLFPGYRFFLNIGGIANLSARTGEGFRAFDICAANRVLNMLAQQGGDDYDDRGKIAASGIVSKHLLADLDALDYYRQASPKSLANDFGTHTVYPLIRQHGLELKDALATYVEHIANQVEKAVCPFIDGTADQPFTDGTANQPLTEGTAYQMMVTGGGAFNDFLITKIREKLNAHNITVVIPDEQVVRYKEALIMALIGVLRWREESNVLSSVTGASRNSVGGAFWMGQEG
ncbi:MAG: anhydro-N-acetylmuramic acid kinase [Chitinophagaceae bacterium]|nr:MAG: anhydro-N-acetylmuramic acid kinase [Chitinophagaceae bacterium]